MLYNTRQYSVREIENLTGVKKSTLYRNLRGDRNGRVDVPEAS